MEIIIKSAFIRKKTDKLYRLLADNGFSQLQHDRGDEYCMIAYINLTYNSKTYRACTVKHARLENAFDCGKDIEMFKNYLGLK